jgi:hypothetical protein
MPAILAGPRICERIGTRLGQAQRVIHLPKWKQPGVGGDHRAAKLEDPPAVEIELQCSPIRFTPPGLPLLSRWIPHQMLNSNPLSSPVRSKSPPHPGNAGLELFPTTWTVCPGCMDGPATFLDKRRG